MASPFKSLVLLLGVGHRVSSSSSTPTQTAPQTCRTRMQAKIPNDLPKCCHRMPYCYCLKKLCASGQYDSVAYNEEDCKDEGRKKCAEKAIEEVCPEDTEAKRQKGFQINCGHLTTDILLHEGNGKAGSAGTSSSLLIFGIIGAVALLALLMVALLGWYCWVRGKKDKQKRSISGSRGNKLSRAKGDKQAERANRGQQGYSKGKPAKTRQKSTRKASVSADRNSATGASRGNVVSRGSSQGRGTKEKLNLASRSFNSRAVNTVDLKTTGANPRVNMTYTKYRNALNN